MSTTSGILLMSMLLQWHGIEARAIEALRRRVLGETHIAEPTWFCIHRLKAEKTWKTIKTPGYPKSLDMKHSRCTWKISAPGKMSIRLAFRGIGLVASDPSHCSSNYLEIIDEVLGKSQIRLCGRKTAGDIVSQGNKVRMDLQRDPSEGYQRGFSLSYMATKAKPGFYAKKTFNEKPLPPLKRPKQKEKDPKASKDSTKNVPKKPTGLADFKNSAVILIDANGQLIQGNPSKRQVNTNTGFKPLSESEGTTGGMSTLVIVGIVIGGLVGLLVIVLILRKLMFKKKKDKNNDGEIIQTNSGLPKINMTHDNVAHAKRNILSPNIVVNRRESLPGPIVNGPAPEFVESSSSDTQDSDCPSDYRKLSEAEKSAADRKVPQRNPSYGQERPQSNGIANRAYEEATPKRQLSKIRDGIDRRSSKRESAIELPQNRKVPYRYNSNKNQGWDQKKALEALNNEKFCEDGKVYIKTSPQRQHATPRRDVISTKESKAFKIRDQRRSEVRHYPLKSVGDDSTVTSDDSEVFPSESTRRRGESDSRSFKEFERKKRLPESTSTTAGRESRLKGGRSRTWGGNDNCLSKPSSGRPIKRRTTVDDRGKKTSKESKNVETNCLSQKKRGYLSEKDYNIKGLNGKTRSRFEPEPPSPSLPRHIVPSSRR